MSIDENIRWQFCYEGNFCPYLEDLKNSVKDTEEKINNNQFDEESRRKFLLSFKIVFYGAIKTLRWYLRYQGIFQTKDFEVIKEAFYTEIIENGQAWVDIFFDINEWNKNIISFNENAFSVIKEKYIPVFEDLKEYFKNKMSEENE